MFKITALDHLVLTVRDPEVTGAFYQTVLGLEVVEFEGGSKALVCGSQKIKLHQQGREPEPRAQQPTPGSADICFITAASLPEVVAHLATCGVAIIRGPVRRFGARGPMESIYFRDPDLNLVEVASYGAAGPEPREQIKTSGEKA